MKRKGNYVYLVIIIIVIIIIIIIICLVSILTVCSKYISQYDLEDCSISSCEYNNGSNIIEYNRKFKGSNYTLYIDTKIEQNKKIDEWISNLNEFSNIFNAKEINTDYTIYLSDNLISNYWVNDNGTKNISFSSKIMKEEAFAWILQAIFDRKSELPYGIFAGVSVFWLNKTAYSNFVLSSINNLEYLTELQFPLYETDNLPEKEKNYAWSFSYAIVKEWIRSGKDESELVMLDYDILLDFLQEKYGLSLPNYSFFPYSSMYEYKIKQSLFTYFVNKEYEDLIIPKSCFTTSYNYLSDWLKDNEKTTIESNNTFKVNDMYEINVFLDNGLKSTGITGEAYSDYIRIYSIGSFSHEYIHHILFKKGKSGYLCEVLPELHANNSKYAQFMWYYLFSGNATHFPYDKSINEKKLYEEALKLYNRINAFTLLPDNFNFWLYADCYAALNTKIGSQFISRLQSDSLHNYIAQVYGGEYVWELNMNNTIMIDEKTYTDISYEWVDYLKSIENKK